MSIRKAMIAFPLLLAGCGGVQVQPADPNVTAAIVRACTADGVFKNFGGRLVLATVDPTRVAAPLVAAGVDVVCGDPARFAGDAATVAWVVKNIGATIRNR